jgi:hypothetical protein
MYKRKFTIFFMLVGMHFFIAAGQVDTIGLGFIENNDISKARQAAIEDAKRLAVEQLLGSYISARTETKNFMLASEKIYAVTKGKLDRFDVLDEGKLDSATYQVKIRAYTDTKAVAKEVTSLLSQNQWSKKPRIKLAMTTNLRNGNNQEANEMVKTNAIQKLTSAGFIVLDNDAQLGASFQLQISVTASTRSAEFQGVTLNSSQLSLSGFLLNAATQDNITAVSFTDKRAGNASADLLKMVDKLTTRLVQKVNLETRFAWLSLLEIPVLIEIMTPSAPDILMVRTNLEQAVIGLSGISTETSNQQSHLLSASYLGWPEQLYDHLTQLSTRSDIGFNVVSFEQSKLTLSIK